MDNVQFTLEVEKDRNRPDRPALIAKVRKHRISLGPFMIADCSTSTMADYVAKWERSNPAK